MNFLAKKNTVSAQRTQCAVVFAANKTLLPSAAELDAAHEGLLSSLIENGDLNGSVGHSIWVTLPSNKTDKRLYDRILIVQLGKSKSKKTITIDEKDFLNAVSALASLLTKAAAKDAAIYLDELSVETQGEVKNNVTWVSRQLASMFEKASYRYTETKSDKGKPCTLTKVTLLSSDTDTVKNLKSGLLEGSAIGKGQNFTRELGNLPANICTPNYLSDQAKKLASGCPALSVKVLGEKQMEKLGMGSLLSVGHGSDEESKLIIMDYKGKGGKSKPNVIVGKGITFDTGGISLKPGAGMDEMKFDMCGAASVFGTMKALVEMNAKVDVVAIVAAAENMPSGRATKPGDVVTSMSGQTIEVLNTDAEGRLVLCDALTYAERFKPKSVVDIATLTGACVIALGKHATGLYSNDQKLADSLLKSGVEACDKAWQMPLWDEYQKQLDSNFADIANIGGREAGSVTAACFLSRFTKKYPWAHLDIAGTAWNSGAAKGATGRPVGLLVNYLLTNA